MDLDEFTLRVRAMAPRLHRIAYLILHNEADCEDATQEALLRAWPRIHALREEKYFETWLIRILINECKRLIRKQTRPHAALPSGSAADSTDVYDALSTLPANYRAVIVLHYIEGYSLKEIAQIENIPASTVKWRLYQGRRLMKHQLSGEEAQT